MGIRGERLLRLWICAVTLLAGWFYWHCAGGIHPTSHSDEVYSAQLDAWLHGHTYLKYIPAEGLLRLKDPYDSVANAPFRILDLTYFQGRYYSYFGAGPIVLLLGPWHALTGAFLPHAGAVFLFVLGSLGLLQYLIYSSWRRWFEAIGTFPFIVATSVAAFGNLWILHLLDARFYQLAQASANFCQLALLVCCFHALVSERRGAQWICFASFWAGMAVACRPSFLLGSVALIPVCFWVGLGKTTRLNAADRLKKCLRIGTAAMLPAAMICVGLFAYNSARFGSAFEFGTSYVLDGDQRGLKSLSLGYVSSNTLSFFFRRLPLVHFFPFSASSVEPVGLIYFPFLFLSLGGAFASTLGKRIVRRDLRVVVNMTALTTFGVFCSVALFVKCWLRYEIDFFVPGLFAAILGWFTLYVCVFESRRLKHFVSVIGALSAAVTIAFVLLLSAAHCDVSRIPMLAKSFNRMVDLFDRSRGFTYGPVRLIVTLPERPGNYNLPLLSTGYYGGDLIYLSGSGDGRIAIGFFHAGIGGPISEFFQPGNGKRHLVEITMGSLLPVAEHPLFGTWTPQAINRAKHLLLIKWDDRELLRTSADFYESAPANVHVGRNTRLPDVAEVAFPTPIASERLNMDSLATPNASFSGISEVEIKFPGQRAAGTDPILSTGVPGAGDLFLVKYLPGDKIQFGVDSWGEGLFETEATKIDFAIKHTLVIRAETIVDDDKAKNRFALILDGKWLVDTQKNFHRANPDTVYWGINSVRSSISSPMFGGTVVAAKNLSRGDFYRLYPQATVTGWGAISMAVIFQEYAGHAGEPLVVSGETGAGDLVYLIRDDSDHVHFCFDHWGVGGIVGAPAEINFQVPHRITVEMPSLFNPENRNAAQSQTIRVALDGKIVLEGKSPCHPSTQKRITIGRNEIGSSGCGPVLFGELIEVSRIP